jgi:hypothetical protein
VTSAFLYLVACSLKNRVVRRIRRLKEPKYLAGAVVGGLYLYFAFFRQQFRTMRRMPRGVMGPAVVWVQAFGAVALWLVVLLAWIFPNRRPPLQFSSAEVQFLFTAPVSRRRLVHYKLLRSQIGVLFSALMALLVGGGAAPSRLSFVLGLWLLLATLRLHLIGLVLSRASLMEPGGRRRVRAWLPLGITAVASAVLVATLAVPVVPVIMHATPGAAAEKFLEQAATGLPALILWPFKALIRPILADGPWAFLRAAWPALLLLALNYAWVMASDARLEQAAIASERRRSEGRVRTPAVAVRRAPFTLASQGRPELAILWKNLLMIGRYLSVRNVVRFGAPLIGIAVAVGAGASQHAGGLVTAAVFCLVLAAVAPLMGPQMVRNDLRSDLAHLTILKTWPLSGEAIITGELLAPTLLVSGFAWLCILLALLLSIGIPIPGLHPDDALLSGLDRLALAAAAMLGIPAVVVVQLVIQNGMAVLFPGWIVTGPSRPRGIEAMGQQMLLFAGTILLLAIGLLPAAVVAGIVGFLAYWIAGWVGLLPAALLFAAILLAESWLVIHALGRVLDRTDPSAVEAAE